MVRIAKISTLKKMSPRNLIKRRRKLRSKWAKTYGLGRNKVRREMEKTDRILKKKSIKDWKRSHGRCD